jgi:hypothetical protein
VSAPAESSPYRLLVEGADDVHAIIHLLKRHGYDWDDEASKRPYVSAAGGVPHIFDAFGVALKGPYERVGLVLDANGGVDVRWQQLQARAQASGVNLPAGPDNEGVIVPGRTDGSEVGVWLMPNNASPGTLEDFLVELVPPRELLWAYAQTVVAEARTRGARYRAELKAALFTWLAWQEEPGLPFGTALRAGVLRHDSPTALVFVDWFRGLFP